MDLAHHGQERKAIVHVALIKTQFKEFNISNLKINWVVSVKFSLKAFNRAFRLHSEEGRKE